jgi:N-acetylmuramoyl-L-alanine amidase
MPKYCWILDNGHGNNTAGKRSPKFDDGSQLLEYEFNRFIVNELAKQLTAAGIANVVLVPEQHDISLKERIERANNVQSLFPKFLISVHANAEGDFWGKASGIETFYYETSKLGRETAAIFQSEFIEELGWKDRGIKTANFYMIKHSKMPAILTETGFYSNKVEAKALLDTNVRLRIVQAFMEAIQRCEN